MLISLMKRDCSLLTPAKYERRSSMAPSVHMKTFLARTLLPFVSMSAPTRSRTWKLYAARFKLAAFTVSPLVQSVDERNRTSMDCSTGS
jgi:hypothetical protein